MASYLAIVIYDRVGTDQNVTSYPCILSDKYLVTRSDIISHHDITVDHCVRANNDIISNRCALILRVFQIEIELAKFQQFRGVGETQQHVLEHNAVVSNYVCPVGPDTMMHLCVLP